MNYYKIVGEAGFRGGFKFGRHFRPGDVVALDSGVESLPSYFQPATALDYVNFVRSRNGQGALKSVDSGQEVECPGFFSRSAESKAEEHKLAVRFILGELDRDNPDHWTEAGEPRVDVVTARLFDRGSWATTREEIESLSPGFRRHHGGVSWE